MASVVDHAGTSKRQPDDARIGFQPPGFTVDVRQVAQKQWELLHPLHYTAAREAFVVDQGEPTDFASVPRVFVWFIPTYGKYTKAAILHDHLCELSKQDQFSRRDADLIFCQAMRVQQVAFLRRWVMWTGVRWGALATRDGRKDWIRDAWLVLPITFLVAFVLLPPAALIVIALLLWFALEVIAWLFLDLACRIRTWRGTPSKRVNRPRLTFRL